MLHLVTTLTLVFSLSLSAIAQPCELRPVKERKYRRVLKEYIEFCKAKGFLRNGIGIIAIYQQVDQLGQLEWYIGVSNQDHYTDQKPPIGWSNVAGEIVLWYTGLIHPKDTRLTQNDSLCLSKVIGNRVTKRPPPPKPTVVLDAKGDPILDKNGKPIMAVHREITGGGSGVDMHITFKRDGSVLKLISL